MVINRLPNFCRLYDFKTRRFVNRDGDLQPNNIWDAVLLSFDSPIAMWVLYNHVSLANNSWAIHPKYFRTNFSSSFPVYNFFKLHKKEDIPTTHLKELLEGIIPRAGKRKRKQKNIDNFVDRLKKRTIIFCSMSNLRCLIEDLMTTSCPHSKRWLFTKKKKDEC